MNRTFTGRHMAAIMVGFFAVVILVNIVMARFAAATFGGVVVANSYVASQQFNRWLDAAEADRAMGWQATAKRLADGKVAVSTSAVPAGARIVVWARHPLGRLPDQELRFVPDGSGGFISTDSLPSGRWRLRISLSAAARTWRSEQDLP